MSPTPAVVAHAASSSPKFDRRSWFRIARIGLGVGLIGVAVYVLWWRGRNVVSRVGYINGTVINLYATIPGTVTLEAIEPGQALNQGQAIGQITNDRNPQLETDRQNLVTRLAQAQAQRRALDQKIASRERIQARLTAQAESQRTLENQFYQEASDRTRNELRQAQENLALAEISAQRFTSLVESGAVSKQLADEAVFRAKEARAVVAAKQDQLRQQQTALTAIRQGLQLDASRQFSTPDMRLLDLEADLVDLALQRQEVDTTILEIQQEITNIKAQIALQRQADIKIPVDSVVWSVTNRTGVLGIPLTAGDPILELVNCQDTWASALISERERGRVRVGQDAEVRLLDGTNTVIPGQVRAIRGGPGKVTAGADVAVPPPDLVRNELEIQVTLLNKPDELDAANFCGIGQSVEVILK